LLQRNQPSCSSRLRLEGSDGKAAQVAGRLVGGMRRCRSDGVRVQPPDSSVYATGPQYRRTGQPHRQPIAVQALPGTPLAAPERAAEAVYISDSNPGAEYHKPVACTEQYWYSRGVRHVSCERPVRALPVSCDHRQQRPEHHRRAGCMESHPWLAPDHNCDEPWQLVHDRQHACRKHGRHIVPRRW
jgi:hypothetical protein